MKNILVIIACILLLHALSSIGQYIMDFDQLAVYGKGYLFGKVLLLLAGGAVLIGIVQKPATD